MKIPRLCLIGVGHFGGAHLHEWLKLQQEGRVEITALVVRSDQSRERLAAITDIPVLTDFVEDLLDQVDIVDIVTPAETHFELIKKCIPSCHVLVEKPVVTTQQELDELEQLVERYPDRMMVGHNYRFNPVVHKLKELVQEQDLPPKLAEIIMMNEGEKLEELDPNLEFIHAFDIMSYLFDDDPTVEISLNIGNGNVISIRYGDQLHCVMKLGWHSKPTKRSIKLVYDGKKIYCDLLRYTVRVEDDQGFYTFNLPHEKVSLRNEMLAFLDFVHGKADNPVSPEVAAESVRQALRTVPVYSTTRPRVAVIGGGVFGTNCALELDNFCEVSVFERHDKIMEEVSFVNQWRHHAGFHYPRSYDTIQEIRVAKNDFEELYSEAITRDRVSYFCPSSSGVEIPAERYLAACSSNYLSFSIEYPPSDIINRDSISISLKTDEGVYDFYKLREIIESRLADAENVQLNTSTNIVDAELLPNGVKRLYIERDGKVETEEFDYLINATYSNRNLLAKWFSFPVESLRFDLYEMLVVRLPIKQLCITIIDGPFTSLVGMGYDNLFLLSHIHDSVSKSVITPDGMPPDWGVIESNSHNMIASASKYIPVLKDAEIVESRYATRAVNAYTKDFDARPTVIRQHGFGCWSVMGGKIITCVSNAREIAAAIARAH
jgi:predicted dehydrogenase